MGEPLIDEDAARWRWITRAGRTRELRILSGREKELTLRLTGKEFKQAQLDAEEGEPKKRAMYG